jgi:diguanylate cyclase (GGDEF)-like protein
VRVLVVDDDSLRFAGLQKRLLPARAFHAEYTWQRDPVLAAESVAAGRVDLMVVGPLAPADRVSDLVRRCGPAVPTIVLTAGDEPDTAAHWLSAGAEDVLAYQSSDRELERTLHRAVHRSRMRRVADRRCGLTGLDQLPGFLRGLRRQLRRAHRTGRTVTVLMVDVDDFDRFNRTYGRDAGDQALVELGRRLRSQCVGDELTCRVRDDQFAFASSGGDELAERLRRLLGQPMNIDGLEVSVECSVGVVSYPTDGRFAEELLDVADRTLNRAKYAPEGRVIVASSSEAASIERSQLLLHQFGRALQEGQLRLVFQPQFRGPAGGLRSLEALCRWQHPTLGAVSPGEFVPLLEASGRVYELDRWVLRAALAQRREWVASGLEVPPVAVNVSAQSFTWPSLPTEVVTCLRSSGQPASALEVELTETSLLDPRAEPTVRTLSELGVSLAVDDFGVGYAALGCLTRTEAALIKLDRSLISHIDSRPREAMLVSGLVRLTHELGIEVMAEGVETEAQLRYLLSAGVDAFQGFLFARPMEADATAAFLQQSIGQPFGSLAG